ncbi:MAG: STAS domain-containing protein [Pseudomonadota bacterium]
MAEDSTGANATDTLVLPARLDTGAAAQLATDLADFQGAHLTLDGAAVTRIGARAVEILRAAAKDWGAAGRSLLVSDPSDDLIEDLRLLGFTPQSLTEPKGAGQ